MDLREMLKLVREVYPVDGSARLSMSYDGAMTGALVFRVEGKDDHIVSIAVPWSQTPEEAFARHVAGRARFLADKVRLEADVVARRAAALADDAAKLEARAAELEAAVPAKGGA
jgi:hypothetical protein